MNARTPGVYILEKDRATSTIQTVGMGTAAFVGLAPDRTALVDKPTLLLNYQQFQSKFAPAGGEDNHLAWAVRAFFANKGARCYVVNTGKKDELGNKSPRSGLYSLEEYDDFSILCAPGFCDAASYEELLTFCENRPNCVAILDAPQKVDDFMALTRVATVTTGGAPGINPPPGLRARDSERGFGTLYFPWLEVKSVEKPGLFIQVPPSGFVAGVWARTEVHKAPAGKSATLNLALGTAYRLTDEEQGPLNEAGVNCIRFFAKGSPTGTVVWGARTLAPASSAWRYVNIRRIFSMIEESIATSTRGFVFEPNDERLRARVRCTIRAFLLAQWQAGALVGRTPEQAFFVKCDDETNPPESVYQGKLVIRIGIAPVYPAEFVIFEIGHFEQGTEITES